MRAILTLVSTITCAAAVFVAGLTIAAYSMREYEPHHFAHMDTPDMWTSKPVVVDTAKQDYERLEAVRFTAYVPATDGDVETASLARSEEREAQAGVAAPEAAEASAEAIREPVQAAAMDGRHVDWCLARYRSYQVADNSYQPYGGGLRQECISPMVQDQAREPVAGSFDADGAAGNERIADIPGVLPVSMGSQEQPPATIGATSINTHEAWCHERYRSYRTEDNSYQPFDGGPRRACMSPYG